MNAVINTETAKANISANVRRLLDERGMSVYQLAKKTGEPPNTVYRIARGDNEPGTVLLCRIAEALECTMDDLLAFPEKKKKRA